MITLRSTRRIVLGAVLGLAGAILAAGPGTGPGAQERGPVAVLTIQGAIGPATADYVSRSLEKARGMSARAVVIRMDTPGGLSSSMRDIIQDILASPVPVISYVAPAGARAASAGTYMLYASHVAAMAPGTNLGAATPVQIGGGGGSPFPGGGKPESGPDSGKDDSGKEGRDTAKDGAEGDEAGDAKPAKPGMEEKSVNDARAYIRSLAQMRGRNADWAERAVSEAASLSAADALDQNVIDLMATSLEDLLQKAHGRTVKVAAGEVTVDTEDAPVTEIAPDWRNDILSIITNPNVAYILMLIGFYGIILEFYNPGTIFSGVIGAICLLLALFALNVLPVNYAGLALIVLGFALMAAEAFVPSFGILGFGGIAALVIGSVILIDTDAPGFGISYYLIGAVAAVSAAFTFLVLAMAAKAWRRPVVSGDEALVGAPGRVIDWVGETGNVRVQGEVWKAHASRTFSPGQDVRVTGREGLTVEVAPAGSGAGDPAKPQDRHQSQDSNG